MKKKHLSFTAAELNYIAEGLSFLEVHTSKYHTRSPDFPIVVKLNTRIQKHMMKQREREDAERQDSAPIE